MLVLSHSEYVLPGLFEDFVPANHFVAERSGEIP